MTTISSLVSMSTRLRVLGTKALTASHGTPEGSGAASDPSPTGRVPPGAAAVGHAGRLQASTLRRIASLPAMEQRWLQEAAGTGHGFAASLLGRDTLSLYSPAGSAPAHFRWDTGADLSRAPYGHPFGARLPTGLDLATASGARQLALAYGLPAARRGLEVSV